MSLVGAELFVGREGELAALVRALDDVSDGAGRLVLVTGEAGIGKTTLVERLLDGAEQRGVEAGVGRAWEGAGAPPWWIWRAALRPFAIDLELPKALADEEARFACLETIAEAVRDLAAAGPVVLVLDDLQWADVSSLLALKLLARSPPASLLLIGTLREPSLLGKETAEALAGIRREATVLKLAGLSRSEIAALASDRGLVSAPAIDATARITGGNPFFATRLLDDPRARSYLVDGSVPPTPHGVAEILVRHLDQLTARERTAVEWAAVERDPVDVPLIVATSGLPGAAVRAALERAREAGIFASSDPPRFAHDLFRSAVYGEIPSERRSAMHLALARALAQGIGTEARAAEHFFLADPDGTSEETALAARLAARAAISRLAFEEAVTLARRAAAADERAGRRGASAMALALVAEATLLAGDAAGSAASAEHALAIARDVADPEPFARAALALGLRRKMLMSDAPLIATLDEALSRVGRSGTESLALRCALEARLGAALQPTIDPQRALATARSAIEHARASNDRTLLARTVHEARPAFRLLEPLEERLSLDRELSSLAEVLGDANLAAHARGRLFWLALESGDAIEADLHLAEYERLAGSLKIAQHELGAGAARVIRASMTGDFDEADIILDSLEASRDRWASSVASRMPVDVVSMMRTNLGALRGVEGPAPVLLPGTPAELHAFFELLHDARSGRLDKARKAWPSIAARFLSQRVVGFFIRTALAEGAILVRDPTHAHALTSLLEPFSGRHAVGTPMPAYEGSIDRLLAGLAALQGDVTRAERLYDAAIAAEEALGAAPFVERTRRERTALIGATPPTETRRDPRTERPEIRLSHEGDTWLVRFDDEEVRIKDAVGLHYLAHLVARPDVPVSALELFATRTTIFASGSPLARPSDAGAMLDPRAIAAYRARARELREILEEADSRRDLAAAESARTELAFLEEELRAAVGLGGRSRKAGSESERVRVNVTTRIRKAIERLRERAPHAAHFLATTIRTGTTCIYRPPPTRGGRGATP